MSKWKVTVDIDGDVYEPWQNYLADRGIKHAGPESRIRAINSEIFRDAIKAKMEEGQ